LASLTLLDLLVYWFSPKSVLPLFSDHTFDSWVHTGRNIIIKQCSPDSLVARQKLPDPKVRYIYVKYA